jgi:hypothetical protein
MDSLMKRVYEVHDIWDQLQQQHNSISYILTIKLTNTIAKTEGRLVLFDLLNPSLSPIKESSSSKGPLYKSCYELCKFIYPGTLMRFELLLF